MSDRDIKRPDIGIGVCILKEGKILFGKRKNSHGEGSWSFPGGHLEWFETWENCAKREVFEETDLKIKNVKYAGITNDMFRIEKKHYITIFIIADYESGILNNKEPEKCSEWNWFSWDNLPEPLFQPIETLIEQGFTPWKHR